MELDNIPDPAPEASPETPPVSPPIPRGLAALHAALEAALREAAQTLSLPLGMEGETFTPPLATHLRGKIGMGETRAAALGSDAPTRVDGDLEITVVTQAGLGLSAAVAVAQSLCRLLPRGRRLLLAENDGECTLCSPKCDSSGPHTDRCRVVLRIPYYAFVRNIKPSGE